VKMLAFVLYKEFLEFRSDKKAIAYLVLQSVAMGLVMPTVMYLRLIGVLPMGIGVPVLPQEEMIAMIRGQLEVFIPLLLPAFISTIAAMLVVPAIVQESESRTLERLLSLPLSWRDVVLGKLLFYFMVSLVVAYITVLAYLLLSRAIVEGFHPPALVPYVVVLVPAVVFYDVSTNLFASARARSVKMANVLAGILTWGLFIGAFLVAWAMGVELGRDFILTIGVVLLAIGLTLAYLTTRVNPEKLLYGRSS